MRCGCDSFTFGVNVCTPFDTRMLNRSLIQLLCYTSYRSINRSLMFWAVRLHHANRRCYIETVEPLAGSRSREGASFRRQVEVDVICKIPRRSKGICFMSWLQLSGNPIPTPTWEPIPTTPWNPTPAENPTPTREPIPTWEPTPTWNPPPTWTPTLTPSPYPPSA
jgi:hypothetical protein